MIDWLLPAVPLLKALHIAALTLWCGGLLVLPLMLSRHYPVLSADDFQRIRRATHLTYTMFVTPAAVIAVIAGTWLVFLRELFVPWLYAKLLLVAVLVAAHAWIGHLLVSMAERPGRRSSPEPYLPIGLVVAPVLGILFLVLGKPDLGGMEFPGFMTEPLGRQFPLEVPSR